MYLVHKMMNWIKNYFKLNFCSKSVISVFKFKSGILSSEQADVIEFIGPSCVGKSTLIRALKKKGMISEIFVDESRVSVEQKLQSKYLSLLRSAVSSNVLNLAGLNKKFKILTKFANLSSISGQFLVDEGLGAHFTSELIRLSTEDKDLFYSVVSRRAFVNVTASPVVVLERIRERELKSGKLPAFYKVNSTMDIEKIIQDSMACYSLFCTQARAVGVPVLDVDSSLNIDEKVFLIERFISKLSSNRDRV